MEDTIVQWPYWFLNGVEIMAAINYGAQVALSREERKSMNSLPVQIISRCEIVTAFCC